MAGKIINGINTDALTNTIKAIKGNPEIAKFQFRASNKWLGGTHNSATVKDFYGGLKEDDSRAAVRYEIDEPPVLLGNNEGSNPVEYLMVALSGCLTTSLVAHAAARGVELKSVDSKYEGDIDLRGFLGVSEEVPVGYRQIRVFFRIEADIPEEKKEELVLMAQKYSPVFNTITKSARVSVSLDNGTAGA